jgi:hypothetical protein
VTGPKANLCNECVDLILEIAAELDGAVPPPVRHPKTCTFCGELKEKTVAGPTAYICHSCAVKAKEAMGT